MILVGLTGGVATGKSTVADMFKSLGAAVIDADVLARQVVEPGKPAWRDIVRTFGRAVLNGDRSLNRQLLGDIVFKSTPRRRQLERIIHPRVARLQAQLTRAIAATDPRAVVVYEVPLLYEAGVDARVDMVIVVTADHATQVARLIQRTGLPRREVIRRIHSQMPLAEKRRRADLVLDGTVPRGRLKRRIAAIYQDLRRRA